MAAMPRLSVRLARGYATPALLAGALVMWFVVRGAGVPAVVSSVVVSVAAVCGLLALERLLPGPRFAPRPPGTLASDLGFNVLTMVVAIVLPAVALVPMGRAVGVTLGTTHLWPEGRRLWTNVVA